MGRDHPWRYANSHERAHSHNLTEETFGKLVLQRRNGENHQENNKKGRIERGDGMRAPRDGEGQTPNSKQPITVIAVSHRLMVADEEKPATYSNVEKSRRQKFDDR